jgi:PII-like signaling protein
MLPRHPAKLLRLHFSEQDRYEGAPLHEAIANTCLDLGIAGITVFRGMEGYGESAALHRRRVLAHDQPIVVTVVESAENIERLMPRIEQMLDTGMVAISDVETIRVQNGVVETRPAP